MLTGYRLMWMTVMFDLPVVEAEERRAATRFRNSLLDLGFQMCQYSVYMRFCTSGTQVETYCNMVEQALPIGGKVNILQFTDKQYERIICFQGRLKSASKKSPDQFDLF
ncbi:CRISPR-associated endonuclease Cas2 [Roseateles sp.]|jgi:CRISPR-associated protein Cas2|uniref:CRISPR-associated endonuclease Cas2 n=1 Tax=Roseateles sp. TaxID=1971397 RepID=UPI00286D2CC6|nr:CRISPR-associated endonuclease Cas2 [Roseateles sp.]